MVANSPVSTDDSSQQQGWGFLNNLRNAARRTWQGLQDSTRALKGEYHADLPSHDQERLYKQMLECLDERGGEASARKRTVALGKAYLELSPQGKERFMNLLAGRFTIPDAEYGELCKAFLNASTPEERQKICLQQFEMVHNHDCLRLLRQFSSVPQGVKFLVDMRADLLAMRQKGESESIIALRSKFKHLLSNWFDVGLLQLHTITWDSPVSVVEKLMIYEAVHEITGLHDMKNRLDSDRRCYAFFHAQMPGEPLISVQVALHSGMADNIQKLLDINAPATDPEQADFAIFYSISNAQRGLDGISLGNFLIKQVVEKIKQQLPNVKHFATLSPIPGFRGWLDPLLEAGTPGLLNAQELRQLGKLSGGGEKQTLTWLRDQLKRNDWQQDAALADAVKEPLTRLCARYLEHEKRKDGQTALDPVEHFHLTNGARLERINWQADTSPKGMKQSYGMMVNYYYNLNHIDNNHMKYNDGIVVSSRQIRSDFKPQARHDQVIPAASSDGHSGKKLISVYK